jgi:hypothetical protein
MAPFDVPVFDFSHISKDHERLLLPSAAWFRLRMMRRTLKPKVSRLDRPVLSPRFEIEFSDFIWNHAERRCDFQKPTQVKRG